MTQQYTEHTKLALLAIEETIASRLAEIEQLRSQAQHLRAVLTVINGGATATAKKRVWTDEMKARQTQIMKEKWAARRAAEKPAKKARAS